MNKLILISLLLLTAASCKKEDLPRDITEEVKFYFKGTIGTRSVTMEAGNADLYMHTGYGSVSGLVQAYGTFATEDTAAGDSSLSFSFFGDALSTSSASSYFSSPDFYTYSGDSIHEFEVTYYPYTISTTLPLDSFRFSFGDGTSYSSDSTSAIIHSYTAPGTYNVTYTVYQANYTDSVVNQIVLISGKTCFPQLTILDSNSTKYHIVAINLGNNYTITNLTTLQTYTSNYIIGDSASLDYGPNEYELVSSAPCDGTFRMNVFGPTPYFPATIFNYTVAENFSRDDLDGKVRIDYLKNGTQYSSDGRKQNILKLVSATPYQNNSNGQMTYQIKAKVDGYLYNIANPEDSIPIRSTDLSFAIALPQ